MNDQPENLEQLLLNDSFVRWISGYSGDDSPEGRRWRQWMREKPGRARLVEEAKQVLQAMQADEVRAGLPEVEEELEILNSRLDAEASGGGRKRFSRMAAGRHHNHGSYPSRYRYLAAAAAVLLIFAAGLYMLSAPIDGSAGEMAAERQGPVQTTITERMFSPQSEATSNTAGASAAEWSTGYAEKATILLEGGTKIILNANSTLAYREAEQTAGRRDRDVTLRLEGEANFDVAGREEGRDRLFTVMTQDGWVRVLGTEFTVQAQDEHTRVALREGKVEIGVRLEKAPSGTGMDEQEQADYTMKPGELVRFTSSGATIEVAEIDPGVYFSWTDKQLVFDGTPVSQIIRRIEQTYGVYVSVRDEGILSRQISGSIRNNDLDVLLKALSKLLNTSIERNQAIITIGD